MNVYLNFFETIVWLRLGVCVSLSNMLFKLALESGVGLKLLFSCSYGMKICVSMFSGHICFENR